MSEIEDILSVNDRVSGERQKFALATVISTDGPSYRSPGARSLIIEDGSFRGGLSAGCLEGDIACRLDGGNRPFIVEYDLSTEDDIRGFPFGCGGTVEIFVEPLPNDSTINAVRWLSALFEPAVLFTVVGASESAVAQDLTIAPGARFGMAVTSTNQYQGGLVFGDVASLCPSLIASKKSKVLNLDFAGRKLRIFAEYFEPAVQVCIFGDGEDARFLESLASNVGMNVRRISKQQIRDSVHLMNELPNLTRSFNVVMTHDLNFDTKVTGQIIASMSPYIGLLGPLSRSQRIIETLGLDVSTVFSQSSFYAPVGLNMAAETPQEIALSILAEIQTVARGRPAGHLRDWPGAIHERAHLADSSTQLESAEKPVVV